MLYGRDAECRLVDDLLQGARRGRSDALVLRGEAGIGKSALLRYAAEQSGEARVLEIRGVQVETAIPFAGLHALLHPVVDRVHLLSPPQRAALGVALGLEAGEAPSRFLVSAALLELLAALAEDGSLICLVDDAQWVDPQSLAALTFAGRRLRGDRIAMLLTVRSAGPGEQTEAARLLADLRQVDLTGLDECATERLLDERAIDEPNGLDSSARNAVKAAARGKSTGPVGSSPGPGSRLGGDPTDAHRAAASRLPPTHGRARLPRPDPSAAGRRGRHRRPGRPALRGRSARRRRRTDRCRRAAGPPPGDARAGRVRPSIGP